METHSAVLPIASAEQIPATLLPELQGLLLKANQAHGPDRTEVTSDEFNRFCLIFFQDQGGWNSSMLPSIPSHRLHKAVNHGVSGPVGHLLEDLPPLEDPSLHVAGADEARKKGSAVYLRADLDTNTSVLNYTFLDDNNNTVAAHLVACQNGPGVLDAHQLATAIRIMDHDVEHLDNVWNEDLTIYLWQVAMYNYIHPEPYRPEENGHLQFDDHSFIRPKRIRDIYPELNNSDEQVLHIIESHRQMEFIVPTP